MNIASIREIKNEITALPQDELIEFCLTIIKSRKENKEFAQYLLFERQNEELYSEKITAFLGDQFATINNTRIFFIKKGFRRIVRLANRYLKYAQNDETRVKVYLFLVRNFDSYAHDKRCFYETRKIVESLKAKLDKWISALHEDLQFDYKRKLEEIS